MRLPVETRGHGLDACVTVAAYPTHDHHRQATHRGRPHAGGQGLRLQHPANFEGDALHALLVLRADELVGCTEGSPEEAELKAIADTIEGYEAIRWPDGKAPGGKG